jgi:anti-anti-sigma factor
METINNRILSYEKLDKNIIVSFNHINRLNSVNSNEVKSELLQLINDSEISIFLDLSEMKFIDSAGFQVLLSAYIKSNLYNSDFIICNANEEILKLFSLLELDKVFVIYLN